MNWKHHLPLLTATALILATQVICTYALINAQRRDASGNLHMTLQACSDSDRHWTFEPIRAR